MDRTIALVDDDRNILTSVSIGLQAEGFRTRVYSDGDTALRALRDDPPHLAVLDVKMLRMAGFEPVPYTQPRPFVVVLALVCLLLLE